MHHKPLSVMSADLMLRPTKAASISLHCLQKEFRDYEFHIQLWVRNVNMISEMRCYLKLHYCSCLRFLFGRAVALNENG